MARGSALLVLSIVLVACGDSHPDMPATDSGARDGDARTDGGLPDGSMMDGDRPDTDAARPDAPPTEDGGMTDAAPDGPDECVDESLMNQCTNASDMAILIDPSTGMQRAVHGAMMDKKASDVAADCARECYFAGAGCYLADACTRNDTVNECVREGVVGLSEGCSSCFVRSLICSVQNCLGQCAVGPTSPSCVECRCRNHCFEVFTECSGLATDALCPMM